MLQILLCLSTVVVSAIMLSYMLGRPIRLGGYFDGLSKAYDIISDRQRVIRGDESSRAELEQLRGRLLEEMSSCRKSKR